MKHRMTVSEVRKTILLMAEDLQQEAVRWADNRDLVRDIRNRLHQLQLVCIRLDFEVEERLIDKIHEDTAKYSNDVNKKLPL